jgi:hypothetical protein
MPQDPQRPWISVAAGALAGLFSDALVHPIDTVRTRLQVQQRASSLAQYTSATDAFIKIIKHEGASKLYKGFGAVAAGTIPGHALYFSGYEWSKHALRSYTHHSDSGTIKSKWHEISGHLMAGFMADIAGALAWTPQDVIKQRMQAQRHTPTPQSGSAAAGSSVMYTSSWQTCRSILREDGFRGLYRGFGAGLLTFGPYVSIYFMLYEQWKLAVREQSNWFGISNPYYGLQHPPAHVYWTGAALSGAISASMTCPLDVIKTRIQTSRRNDHQGMQYRNAWHALKVILKEEGLSAFFQGLKPRALWMASGTAITMMFYEELMGVMGK